MRTTPNDAVYFYWLDGLIFRVNDLLLLALHYGHFSYGAKGLLMTYPLG